jgi:hypothetical protein
MVLDDIYRRINIRSAGHDYLASLVKVFGLPFIKESGKGELCCDFFNVFNTTHLGNPLTGLTNPNLGRITGTNGDPRILQRGLKIMF